MEARGAEKGTGEPGLVLSTLALQSQPEEETVSWSPGALGWTVPPYVLAQLQAAGNLQKSDLESSAFPQVGPGSLPRSLWGGREGGVREQEQLSPTPALRSTGRESQAQGLQFPSLTPGLQGSPARKRLSS